VRRLADRLAHRLGSVALAFLASCGGEAPPPKKPVAAPIEPVELTPLPTSTAVLTSVPTPTEEARQFLDQAKTTADARERCQLIFKAVLLDPKLAEGRLARAKNGCAPARDLLEDAKIAHELAPSIESASVLVMVATRAESSVDAIAGATALLTLGKSDLEKSRLAARTFARFGNHEKAARAYEAIASDRGAKGATLDALDARLDAVLESARCNGKGAIATPRTDLIAAIQAAGTSGPSYGAAWVGPKVVEAIAAVRNAGDVKGAADAAKLAKEQKVTASAEATLAYDLERAIADARAANKPVPAAIVSAEKKSLRSNVAASRALLAVDAKLAGKCGLARTYARIHASLPRDSLPRFDEDVTWAASCAGGEESPSLIAPASTSAIDDALGLAIVDPLRGRAMLQKLVDDAPLSVPARLALIKGAMPSDRLALLDAALSKMPNDPTLRLARFDLLAGPKRGEEAAFLAKEVVPKTIEVLDDPRAAAPVLAHMLDALQENEATPEARADLAEATVKACVAPLLGSACVPPKDDSLAHATAILRKTRAAALAKSGPTLSNADLADARVRLDVVLSLVASNKSLEAEYVAGPKRGAWEGAENALAYAAILSSGKKCDLARARLAQHPDLATKYGDEVAVVKKRCP